MNTQVEENYLKAIYKLSLTGNGVVSTSQLAAELGVQAATVTDMAKKLAAKKLIKYEKYRGVALSRSGSEEAIAIVRKHRLWEVFLHEKLGYKWGEVHAIAEQLEHVQQKGLIDKLDAFLGFPETDPHGDPIPDKAGNIRTREAVVLTSLKIGDSALIARVKNDSRELLDHLDSNGLSIGKTVRITKVLSFDGSIELALDGTTVTISEKVGDQLLVRLQ